MISKKIQELRTIANLKAKRTNNVQNFSNAEYINSAVIINYYKYITFNIYNIIQNKML